MKRILLGVAAVALSASLAVAANDPMASRYENTVVAKTADGKEVGRSYYNADGTVTRKTADGKETKNTWKLENGKVCITQTDPPPPAGMGPVCLAFPGEKKVGDSWDVTLPDGTKLTATLQKGRP
jgi:hypothetical protein